MDAPDKIRGSITVRRYKRKPGIYIRGYCSGLISSFQIQDLTRQLASTLRQHIYGPGGIRWEPLAHTHEKQTEPVAVKKANNATKHGVS